MLSYLMQGGLIMIPLAICSVCALAFAAERAWFLWREHVPVESFWDEVEPFLDQGEFERALEVSGRYDGILAGLVETGLEATPFRRQRVVDEMEEWGLQQVLRLERFLPALNFIARVSPLLGLLGTVAGMIETFGVIAEAGVGRPELLAGGISKALITTATGLGIGIITLFFHHLFSRRVDQITHEMERSVRRVEDSLPADEGSVEE